MNRSPLWAPWRMEYIRNLSPDENAPVGSFLEDYWQHPEKDHENMVLHRGEHAFIVMNRFPYTNGHLMVAPGEAIADLPMMSAEQRAELMELVTLAERLLQAAFNPQGVNIGINIGRCAGAGLPGHLHVHVVPRWAGDVNFMEVVGGVKVIPQALEQVRDELLAVLPGLLA